MSFALSDRFVESLASLQQYAEGHPQGTRGPALTIAISRQAGARGVEIARQVGERLGWPVYDHELLTRIAEEKGLHKRLLERLDERATGWLEEMVTSFGSHEGGREGAYIKHLLEQLVTLGKAGHCVIVGRGGAQILPAEVTLRVRIVAPRAFRVAAIQKDQGITQLEAERWVDRVDQERARFIKTYFHKDVNDPLSYDLSVNSGRYALDDCAALICEAARMLEAHLHAKARA